MPDPRIGYVLVSGTFAAGTKKELNIKWADMPAKEKDRIPPRLSTTLKGTIDWVEVHVTTDTAVAVNVEWYGNDVFASSVTTDVDFYGRQAFANTEFTTVSDAANKGTHASVDAQGLGLYYKDTDDSGEFHVLVDTASGGDAPGIVTFGFIPDYPVGR